MKYHLMILLLVLCLILGSCISLPPIMVYKRTNYKVSQSTSAQEFVQRSTMQSLEDSNLYKDLIRQLKAKGYKIVELNFSLTSVRTTDLSMDNSHDVD